MFQVSGMLGTLVGELRNDLLKLSENWRSFPHRHGDVELVQTTLQRGPSEPDTFRTSYLGAGARQDTLVGIEELLEEFFSRTQADELEFLRRFARQTDQSFCQFGDPNRLSHIKHQDIAVPAYRERLQDQADRLGNSHEEAGYLRMGNREGLVLANLFLKERNYAAIRSQNISETDRDATQLLSGPSRQDQFSYPFGAAHDICRVDRLVRRNHHEG